MPRPGSWCCGCSAAKATGRMASKACAADALRRGTLFACIPGEMDWNAALAARGTLGSDETHALWRYCSEGGVENAQLALRFAAHLIGHGEAPPRARPMPSAGFWRGEPANDERPNAIVIFYRALVAGGDTAGIDALRAALLARGLNAVCLFVTSLKDERSAAFLRAALSAYPPDIIINATAFATATANDDAGILSMSDCPILQVAQAGISRASWEASIARAQPARSRHACRAAGSRWPHLCQCHRVQGARREPGRIRADDVPAGSRSRRCDGRSRAGLGAIAPGRTACAPCRAGAGQLSQPRRTARQRRRPRYAAKPDRCARRDARRRLCRQRGAR